MPIPLKKMSQSSVSESSRVRHSKGLRAQLSVWKIVKTVLC